jgi:hypothetical protein
MGIRLILLVNILCLEAVDVLYESARGCWNHLLIQHQIANMDTGLIPDPPYRA